VFDAALRKIIDPPLNRAGAAIARIGVTADQITIAGFLIGLSALPLIALHHYGWALLAIALNRLCDGLDGAVARNTALSDRGGFLDIVLDFIFYAGVVFAFGLARPENLVPAAFLLFAYMGAASSFLAFAIMAAKRGESTEIRGRKSLYYLGGLAEGTETAALMVASCLFPGLFPLFAWVYGVVCWITAATRIVAGWQAFR